MKTKKLRESSWTKKNTRRVSFLTPKKQTTLNNDIEWMILNDATHLATFTQLRILATKSYVDHKMWKYIWLSFVYQWSRRLLPPRFSEYLKLSPYSTSQSCYGSLYVASVSTTQYGLRFLKFTGSLLWNCSQPNAWQRPFIIKNFLSMPCVIVILVYWNHPFD